MIYYHRINVSEGIDVNNTSKLKKCNFFYCWYFLNKWFQFEPNICNGCHNLIMISMNLSNIANLNIKGSILLAELGLKLRL